MYFYRLLSLVLLAVLTGCISMPLGGDYNTSEWQENRIQLSDVTVSFEAPKHSESFPRPVLIDEVDIFDESLYINSYLQCVKLMWTFTPQRGVNGDLMLKIIVVKYPGNGNRKSVREIIESTMENSASKRNIPVSSRIKNRYKYAAQFSADGPTWLMYDYGSAPTNAMRDYYERCLYP